MSIRIIGLALLLLDNYEYILLKREGLYVANCKHPEIKLQTSQF